MIINNLVPPPPPSIKYLTLNLLGMEQETRPLMMTIFIYTCNTHHFSFISQTLLKHTIDKNLCESAGAIPGNQHNKA